MKTILGMAIASIMGSGIAHAGSFSLYTEGTASAEGNYAAGIAAEAADASTGWYNPAGLPLLHKQQFIIGGVGVFPSALLSGTSTFATTGIPPYIQTFDDIQGAKNGFVPSLHYALPLGQNAAFGLSVVSPFGLATDWGTWSPVRYSATYSKLITTDVSPELGAKITDNLSIGAGLDFQYALVKFYSVLGAPAMLQFFGEDPMFLDSTSENRGHSFAMGFHAGAMLMSTDEHTRVGLNYQSRVTHRFEGQSDLTGRLASPGFMDHAAVFETTDLYTNNIQFPDIVTLSAYRDLTDRIALLGSVVYTNWDLFKYIQLNNVAGNVAGLPNRLISITNQYYEDAWRFSLGANVHVNEKLMLRVGGGFDQTPTTDKNRDIRIPDADRWALSVGAHYQWIPSVGFDVGYTHLWADEAHINKTIPVGPTSVYNVHADGHSYVDLVGLELTWTMDQGVTPAAEK